VEPHRKRSQNRVEPRATERGDPTAARPTVGTARTSMQPLVGTTKCRWDDEDGYPLFKRPRFDATARGEGSATIK
jgi:hypothetical protein